MLFKAIQVAKIERSLALLKMSSILYSIRGQKNYQSRTDKSIKTCLALIWYDIMDFLVAFSFIVAAAPSFSGSLNLANGFRSGAGLLMKMSEDVLR